MENSSLLRQYMKDYRRPICLGLFALVLVDILEVFPPLFLKGAVDAVSEHKTRRQLLYFALAYLSTAFLQGVCRYGWRIYIVNTSLSAGRDLRKGFVDHLFGLSASFFDRNKIGDLMSLAISDVDAVRMALGAGLLTFADSLFYLMTVPIAMYLLSPKLMLLAFLPLPVIPWLVSRNERQVHERFERVQSSFGRIASMAQECLGGVRILKGFAKEDAQLRRFRKAGEDHIHLSLRLARVQSSFGPTLDFTMSLGLVLLLMVGGKSVITGAVSLGTFVAFQRYIQKMVWPMAAFGLAISYYQRAVASSGRLKKIFSTQSEVPDSPGPQSLASPLGSKRGRVELKNLNFRHQGDSMEGGGLFQVSLTIEAGMRVAFVGSIGSGKSTLLSLIPRLYPVARGMLFVDGVDVNDWPLEDLRRQVGYVSQDLFLFSESVLENIAFGLTSAVTGSALAAEVERSAHSAAVHDDVLGLVNGYQTRLGERGVNVSGGQKQRLTLARAILKNPSILILDDALSSVDVQTEKKILEGLKQRSERNTELIAAHRISTIQEADLIVVLDQGQIRQQGTHRTLIREEGIYRRFFEQQRLKEELENYVEGLIL